MPKNKSSLRAISEQIKTAEDLQRIFDQMPAKEKKDLLLTPLSDTNQTNILSHIAYDAYFSSFDLQCPRIELTKIVLNEIEKASSDDKERMDLLTSANALGQTIFHKTIKYGVDKPLFDLLTEKLYQWGGEERADAWMQTFLETPFGTIDNDIAYALQHVREVRPFTSSEYQDIDSLCCENYQPADFHALQRAVDKIRPLIIEWVEAHPAEAKDSYKREQNQKLRAFAENPDVVHLDKTPLTIAFPGEMFFDMLKTRQRFKGLQTAEQKADDIFDIISQQNAEGKTAMHTTWQHSTLLGPPGSAGCVRDSLGTLIAKLDETLGETAALDLTKKLLLLEDGKGALPLDKFQYDKVPERDYYIDAFLSNLRDQLGSRQKFELYVKEIVAAILPSDYSINLSSYSAEAHNGHRPKRGARIEF